MTEFTELDAENLAKWLKIKEFNRPADLTESTLMCFRHWFYLWIQTPDGMRAVEKAMVAMGYEWESNYDNGPDRIAWKQPYYWVWRKKCLAFGAGGKTMDEAALISAYKCYKEENK